MQMEPVLPFGQTLDRHLEGHPALAFADGDVADLVADAALGDAIDVDTQLLGDRHTGCNHQSTTGEGKKAVASWSWGNLSIGWPMNGAAPSLVPRPLPFAAKLDAASASPELGAAHAPGGRADGRRRTSGPPRPPSMPGGCATGASMAHLRRLRFPGAAVTLAWVCGWRHRSRRQEHETAGWSCRLERRRAAARHRPQRDFTG